MNHVIYKLVFKTGVHIGENSLEDSEMCIHSDTFFSALCQMAIKIGGIEKLNKLISSVRNNNLIFSDAFPYVANELFITKPMLYVEKEHSGDSVEKKQNKKMKYIPLARLNDFVSGELNATEINEKIGNIGIKGLRQMTSISYEDETLPYHVGVFHFAKGCGLYLIAGFNGENCEEEFDELMTCLSYEGIGGKRSSGFGKFEFVKEPCRLLDASRENASRFVSLSICLPKDEEMEDVLAGNNSYSLIRRGGFIDSVAISEGSMRKKDLYVFSAGSVFEKTFEGDIFDVSNGNTHPVYKYAKPMWLEV